MSRCLVTITDELKRQRILRWVAGVPLFTRVEFMAPLRTLAQNKRMWAMLTDIADQALWHGLKLNEDDWKDIFSASLGRELRVVPNLEGDGIVVLGRSTSRFSIEEMSNMIDLMFAFGANHNIAWTDPDVISQLHQLEHSPRVLQLEGQRQ